MNVKKFNIVVILTVIGLAALVRADTVRQLAEKGRQFYAEGDYHEALRQYQRIELPDPNEATLLYNQANCYFETDQLDQAIPLYQRVLDDAVNRLDPGLDLADQFHRGADVSAFAAQQAAVK